jgi:hypothetical protein
MSLHERKLRILRIERNMATKDVFPCVKALHDKDLTTKKLSQC